MKKKNNLSKNGNKFNNPTSVVSYNNEDYSLSMEIVRNVDGIGQKDKLDFSQLLDNDKISEFNFISDLAYPIITGSFVFHDIGSFLFSKLTADGRTYLIFNLEKIGIFLFTLNQGHSFCPCRCIFPEYSPHH